MFESSATKLQCPRMSPTTNLLQCRSAIVINFAPFVPARVSVLGHRTANIARAIVHNRIVPTKARVARQILCACAVLFTWV